MPQPVVAFLLAFGFALAVTGLASTLGAPVRPPYSFHH